MKRFVLISIFSLLITYQIHSEEIPTLMDYADKTFKLDFNKADEADMMFIMTRCHGVYNLTEQYTPSHKEKRLEMGAMLLMVLEELHPEKNEDERFDIFFEMIKPSHNLYIEESQKHYIRYGERFNDLHISDLAFCNLMLDPEAEKYLLP